MDEALFKVTHHGAVTGVTGSCHQLILQHNKSLLVDCGLFQGAEAEARSLESSKDASTFIDFPLEDIEALLVTHCHIDHVGRIPYLLAAGFNKPIYATEATAMLLPLVIEDAVKIGLTRNKKIIELMLKKLNQLLKPVPYMTWFPVEGLVGVKAKFKPAGHILGSAYIEIDIKQKPLKSHRVVFSGDLGAPYSPLLAAPKSPYRADTLIIESTYGDRLHDKRRVRRQQLQQIIEHSLEDGGAVLIPAFSIGRTQELLYELEEIIHAAEKRLVNSPWQTLDIIVDSPLASEFTQYYRRLSELWDKEAKRKRRSGRHPLSFKQLTTIDSHTQHLTLVNHLRQTGRPCVVIAASGMCSGGRIVNYLEALLPDNRTDVLFVGYQAKGTPGADIQKWGKRGGFVKLNNEKTTIKANIHTLSGYSAHADQKDLVNFVKRMRVKPADIRIVHGDDKAKQSLKRQYAQLLPEAKIMIPF